MRGDFTRSTFAPAKHYSGVRQQQGRVGLDADWNEQQDIASYLRTTGARDVVGRCGAPLDTAGFGIEPDGAGGLRITPGRYYVDGVLCENDQPTPVVAQPDLPLGAPRVVLADGSPAAEPVQAGRYLVFLDAWSRLVTALDDDAIREKALGGPDTAARLKTVWQVKLLRVGAQDEAAITCGASFASWTTLTTPPTGTLAARAEADATVTDPCEVPAGAGYRRLDNQLYRVEVHRGGAPGTASFVWSRENGSIERRWESRAGDDLRISSPGRDAVLGFPSGCWIELTDDSRELTGRAGTLVRVRRPRGDVLEIDAATATGSLNLADFPNNPRVRRWDSPGAVPVTVPSTGDGWLPLEDGVQVRFAASTTYRAGDYWTVPARTHTGDVEWPKVAGVAARLAPHGVRHAYCHLAIARYDGAAWSVIGDCRTLFPPLTGLTSLFYVAGDGQEAVPDVANAATLVPLPQALRVGVAMGQTPVVGARVRFAVTTGSGKVDGATTLDVPTGADGTAACRWSLDSATLSQQVTARLLDPAGAPRHVPIVFSANHSTASLTAFDPAQCPPLAGTRTVQEAVERLCSAGHGGGCATITVTPGDRWWEQITEALEEGQNAHICFRAGEYSLKEKPLLLQRLGHLTLSGAGVGTHVVAEGLESAMVFEDCESVGVSDMAVSTREIQSAERENGGGTLMFLGCDDVVVERVLATCGDSVAGIATCVVVRPTMTEGRQLRGTVRSAKIRDCHLRTGYLQRGVMLISVRRSIVEDNRVTPMPKPGRLKLDRLLVRPDVRERLVRTLASQLVLAGEQVRVDPGRFNTAVEVDEYVLRFDSSVPPAEWQRLTRSQPPTQEELQSVEAVTAYANRLMDSVAEQPDRIQGFGQHVERLRGVFGNRFSEISEGEAGKALVRGMLVKGEVEVVERAPSTRRTTSLHVGQEQVAFNSVLPAEEWSNILGAMPAPKQAAASVAGKPSRGTAKVLRDAARRLVTDESFRNQFAGARTWFDGLRDRNEPVVRAAVVVGGQVADQVRIAGNTLDGCLQGVQIGLSHSAEKGEAPDIARVVVVTGNVITLRMPVGMKVGGSGVSAANVEQLHVSENRVSFPGYSGDMYFDAGIHVAGHLGPLMIVKHNLSHGTYWGVWVEEGVKATVGKPLWVVSENQAIVLEGAVSAPSSVLQENNYTT